MEKRLRVRTLPREGSERRRRSAQADFNLGTESLSHRLGVPVLESYMEQTSPLG